MANKKVADAVANNEIEKYPDGSPIARYPKWIYPGGNPQYVSPKKDAHNGVLVNSKEEHDAYLKDNPDYAEKAEGWDK